MEKRPCLRRHAPSQKKAVCHPASLSGSGICFHPSLRNMPGIRGLLPCEGSCRGNGKRLHESDERQDEFGRARRPGALARGVAGCHGVSRARLRTLGPQSQAAASAVWQRDRVRSAVTKSLRLLRV